MDIYYIFVSICHARNSILTPHISHEFAERTAAIGPSLLGHKALAGPQRCNSVLSSPIAAPRVQVDSFY